MSAMVVMPLTWKGGEAGTGWGQDPGTFCTCRAEEDGDFPPPRAAGPQKERNVMSDLPSVGLSL